MTNIEKIGELKSTFTIKRINDQSVPFQNDFPYPSFEPQERLTYSLAGKWKKKRFSADHDWTMAERDDEWIKRTEKEGKGITKVDFADELWETHSVPLPENKLSGKAEINGAETYEDGVWYRKKFILEDEWENKIVTLKSLGISYVGDFWLNGQYVGYHEGGYTPFAFDVTSFIRSGENTIVIRVDNPPWTTRADIIPAVNNDFFNYTGIIQDLYLEATDSVHVVRADLVPEDTSGNVSVSVVLENRSKKQKTISTRFSVYETDPQSENWLTSPDAKSICQAKAEVKGLEDQTISFKPFETKVLTFNIQIKNPKLWEIRQPNLYVFNVALFEEEKMLDNFYTQFGLRTITTEKTKICLNEEPVFLAGVARHEEWPGYGRTASWDRIKSDFLTISDLSVNMVRTGHYPNHIYTFIMLDRLGLTAMSEIPLWQFETHHYEIQEKRQISYQMWREMVFSSYNRPSIIMWSTQNESKDVKLRKKYNENLVNEVRSLYNDKRLITQSAAADQPGDHDESMEPLDVAGWTMYFGVFHGSTPYEGTRNFIEQAHQKWPDKPILNTEYGLWSNADESFIEKQVQAYQMVHQALIEKATVTPEGVINKDGFLAGIDYWTVFDWYVNHNQFYQTMGMYHMDRKTTKPLYDEFVKDHKRLMEKTNGMGKIYTDEFSSVLPIKNKNVFNERVEIELASYVDLRDTHYLILQVMDPDQSEGFTVELVDQHNNTCRYETYGLQTGQAFDVMVPLWTLDESVLSSVKSLNILFSEPRSLEVIEVVSSLGAR